MKSTLIWFIFGGAILLFGGTVDAWNRQFFNRYSRNLYQNGDLAGAASNSEIDEFNALFGIGMDAGAGGGAGVGGGGIGPGIGLGRAAISNAVRDGGGGGGINGFGGGGSSVNNGGGLLGLGQQQPEVYGIVEPLIEDLPCVDRPCNVNEDCCPSGICMSSYGGGAADGKCIYDYGRKRDLCHRNADCEPGYSCLKGAAGNLFCQSTSSMLATAAASYATKPLAMKQFGEDCVTSSDCNINKFMCCQLQRTHHRMLPKKMCAFFRDPFMCIDIAAPAEDEDLRESRFLTSFSQRLM